MLERFLAQTWVLVTAFIVGPAILIWLQVRRRRLEQEAAPPGGAGARKVKATKTAAPASRPSSSERIAGSKPLWPGYRGMRWGQPPVEGMTLVHEEGDTRFLVRPSDELRIGAVHISSAAYSFRLDRLEAVVIELPAAGFELLTRHLTSEWGPPRSSPDRSKHVWADPGTGPDATQAVLEKMTDTRTARFVLTSRAANAERAATRPGV